VAPDFFWALFLVTPGLDPGVSQQRRKMPGPVRECGHSSAVSGHDGFVGFLSIITLHQRRIVAL
jgi:hypothetical protein